MNDVSTPPVNVCQCGHSHLIGDDEGADAGCSELGKGCDCWDWVAG